MNDSDDVVVHSGLMPSCEQFGEGAKVAFYQALVTCHECEARWQRDGLPKFLVRFGETSEQFRARTRGEG